MRQILAITGKELNGYFGSPMAAIFVGAFLLASLFFFFWIDGFFARNTADIRPFFRWLPLLLIFLVATLTMRQWSEEQKMGTMEVLFTMPVSFTKLVFGKFLAALFMVALALALTIGLPITVSLLGNLDWGPVLGGYLGGLLMASAYIGIGLFISSRTDNQIVALIATVLAGGFFYLLGSTAITGLFGNNGGELLRQISTAGRFSSIERGVVDLRDVVYYLSFTGIFLGLTALSLDMQRWSQGDLARPYRKVALIGALLLTANLVVVNIWLNKVDTVRSDLTADKHFSISPATKDILASIREPLLLRGYFSDKTHPLLAPLVPQLKDLMTEYSIAGGDRVRVEFIDPRFNEKAEAEANRQYGIQPVPFQVAGRYEASVVNSYFNILIKYGDQYEVLGFQDLIEVEPRPDGQPDVRFRNLEYDLTRNIKKTVHGFKSIGSVFEGIDGAKLTAIISRERLPEDLRAVENEIQTAVEELQKESFGKLQFEVLDPDIAAGGPQAVEQEYGVQPQLASLFSGDMFYLSLFLDVDGKREQVFLDNLASQADIKNQVEATLKRMSSGFLKTVAVWTPSPAVPPQMAMMGQQPPEHYGMVQEILRQDYNVERANLDEGVAPLSDVLVLVAPQELSDVQRVAVDQFLMRGGSLIVLNGHYLLDLSPMNQSLNLKEAENGVEELLRHYGITVKQTLVMDEQNQPFPVPVNRNVGGFTIQEIKRIDYPYFVDVRSDGMAQNNPATANLPMVTLNWVSPLDIDQDKNAGRTSTILFRSSPKSWRTDQAQMQPDYDRYPENGFAPAEKYDPADLTVAVRGNFSSYFAGKPDPRIEQRKKEEEEKKAAAAEGESTENPDAAEAAKPLPPPIIEQSADSSRLIVVGSSEFVNDTVLSLSRSLGDQRFLNSLGFIQNLVDWSVEDEDLLSIRSRGGHARLLMPLSRNEQRFWEILNYVLAFAGLLLVSFWGGRRVKNEKPMQLV